jgi:glycosyltransferase involved in cell wall biosynthesis
VQRLRVLHIPEGALPMYHLCRALDSQGIDATACHFYATPYQFKSDVCLNLQDISLEKRPEKMREYLNEAIKEYDVFHFHFGGTFLPDKSDLEILHQAGKKMVVHHHGSEARILSIARKDNPYVRVKPEWTEEKIRDNLTKLSTYIDHAIVIDHEIETYVKDYYKETHLIPNIIDVHNLKPHYPTSKSAPLLVHAPTRRDLKGTDYVLKAVEQLKKQGVSFQFQLIEKMKHEEMMKVLSKADIVIDQLRIGSFGYFAGEAMALGKPVVSYIKESLVKHYPNDLPIVKVTPKNLTEVLMKLILNPTEWKPLGEKGRAYVEKYHHPEIIVQKHIDIYNKL